MVDKEQLEQKIQYWINEGKFPLTESRRVECETKLHELSRQYKEVTGKCYGR